ncbi:MAG: hypothetical protein ACKO2Q_10645, partial [Actinomycetota bacterium]
MVVLVSLGSVVACSSDERSAVATTIETSTTVAATTTTSNPTPLADARCLKALKPESYERPMLMNCDFRGSTLSGRKLMWVWLRGAQLERVDFS